MRDCNVRHFGKPTHMDLVALCVKALPSTTMKMVIGFYDATHGCYYLEDGETQCKPDWWSYLIDANEEEAEQ